ncbi:aldehyde dehydrogenase (NAD) family protein [Bacteriovorax sp. Seq25_V]|nr:aldehyde dehydrogenase (NAD) family protein [Bacteriovorax sp. Seq25_V]
MQDINQYYQDVTATQNNFKDISKRLVALEKLKSSITEMSSEIADALRKDLGKCEFESYLSEIDFVLHEIDVAKKNIKKWSKPKRVSSSLAFFPVKSYIVPEPYGTVLIIGPWNYPFQLVLAPLVGAIAAGNTSIIKPSEMAPQTSKVITELINKTFSKEVKCVEGGVPETTELLDLKFDYIFYTGNGVVARIIMEKASKFLTPLTLELGGKSPCMIFTANLNLAAKRVVWGKFFNAGQTCVAPDYIMIQEKDKNSFINEMKKWIEFFYTSEVKSSPNYGRIINERHFDRLTKYLSEAKVLLGGGHERESLFLEPTVVEGDLNHAIMKEEIFGPILPIVIVKDYEEARDYVLKNDKPLASYGFFDREEDKSKFVKEISSGGMVINDTLIHLSNEKLPFGGVGESGMGAYHGAYSFDIFSHKKALMKRSFMFENSLRYPPYEGKLNLIRNIMKYL